MAVLCDLDPLSLLQLCRSRCLDPLLLMEQGPSSAPSGRHDDELGEHKAHMRFHNRAHSASPTQAVSEEDVQTDPGVPKMAEAAVVPRLLSLLGSTPQILPTRRDLIQILEGLASSGDHPDDQSNCLASYIQSCRAAGLSQEAAAMARKARRLSTRRTYEKKLRPYRTWCLRNNVNPLRASVKDVGDYLLAIYHHGTSINSIRGHRTYCSGLHPRGFQEQDYSF